MTKLVWDDIGTRHYEAGVDRGVFYPQNGLGEVWNGLTSVQESPSDSDNKPRYIDGVKIANRQLPGQFSGVIEAFTYPDVFYDEVLTQRRPKTFSLSYRVKTDDSYKIHLVYNVLVSPSDHSYQQQTDTSTFSWNFTTKAVLVPGANTSAHFVIDVSKADPITIAELEDVLYGSDVLQPTLPLPEDVINIFESHMALRVIDNGDGTFTVIGSDEAVHMLDSITFELTASSVVMLDSITYQISSL